MAWRMPASLLLIFSDPLSQMSALPRSHDKLASSGKLAGKWSSLYKRRTLWRRHNMATEPPQMPKSAGSWSRLPTYSQVNTLASEFVLLKWQQSHVSFAYCPSIHLILPRSTSTQNVLYWRALASALRRVFQCMSALHPWKPCQSLVWCAICGDSPISKLPMQNLKERFFVMW